MGQAKARGSKDQRVAEAVERARVEKIAFAAREEAERKAFAEAAEAARVAREKENEARRERGEKLLPTRINRNRTSSIATLLAVASIAMLAQR